MEINRIFTTKASCMSIHAWIYVLTAIGYQETGKNIREDMAELYLTSNRVFREKSRKQFIESTFDEQCP